MAKKSTPYPLIVTLIILGAMVFFYLLSPSLQTQVRHAYTYAEQGNGEALAQWFKQWGWWGPAGIMIFMVVQLFLIVIPSWLPMIAATIGYGAVWGTLIAIAGVAMASTVGYILGHSLSHPFTQRVIGEKKEAQLIGLVEQYGFGIVVLFRISPLLSTDAISVVAGILRMPYWKYMLATLTGITPLAIAIAYFSQDLERLKEGLYWLGGLGILFYALYIWLDRRLKRNG